MNIGAESSGKTVALRVGQQVVVRLKGNATTGFLWMVKSVEGGAAEAVGKVEYKPDAAAAGMVGVGGVFEATFRAVAPGKATITLEHRRPWEQGVAPLETFVVTLEVAE
jgi:inhibitor of cysteine peptidase